MQEAQVPDEMTSRVALWMEQGNTAETTVFADADLISEFAVATALQVCKADKACGPGRLGNDWYRAYADFLIPILTRLYKMWYSAQDFPDSFPASRKVAIVVIPSTIDHRPLALLNTDYKILTHLITTLCEI